jgi:hypothetical protein
VSKVTDIQRFKKSKTAEPHAGPDLDARVAAVVMGWKELRAVPGKNGQTEYRGKRPDKLGRWRTAKVPRFSIEPSAAALVEQRLKQLGHWNRYEKELAKMTQARGLPSGWATPEQISRAAIKVVTGSRRSSSK